MNKYDVFILTSHHFMRKNFNANKLYRIYLPLSLIQISPHVDIILTAPVVKFKQVAMGSYSGAEERRQES